MTKTVLQTCLSTAWGGLEMVALETAEQLYAKHFRVLTATRPNSPLAQKLREKGFAVVELNPRHKYLAFFTVRSLRKLLRTEKVDTVLVQQLRDLWVVVPALTANRNIRLVAIAHMFVGIKKKDFLHRWIYGRIEKLVALTPTQKRNLQDHLPLRDEQMVIIPNSIDLKKFNPQLRQTSLREEFGAPPGDQFLVGVVARLDPQKGLLEVIGTAQALRALGQKNFKIVLIGEETKGEPGFRAYLERQIQENALEDTISLAGARSDIAPAMASFDALLMPSPAETFGRVVIEAMASGTAVVAVGGGGVPDIVEHRQNGLLVAAGDTQGMAQALVELKENPDFRQRLTQTALEKVRQVYDTEKTQKDFVHLLTGSS